KRSGRGERRSTVTGACRPRFRVHSLGRSGRPGNGSNLRFARKRRRRPFPFPNGRPLSAAFSPRRLERVGRAQCYPTRSRSRGLVSARINQGGGRATLSYCDWRGTGPKFFSNHSRRSSPVVQESKEGGGFPATTLPRQPGREALGKPQKRRLVQIKRPAPRVSPRPGERTGGRFLRRRRGAYRRSRLSLRSGGNG